MPLRASGSSSMVKAKRMATGGGARRSTLTLARPPWRKKQSLVTLRRSEWSPLCLFPHEDRLQSWKMAAGARVSTLAEARPPWRKKQSLVTVRRSEWRPLCLFPHEDTNYSDFGGRKLTVKTQKKSHACNFTWPKTPLVAFVFTCFHSVCACFWLKRNRCTCCYPKNYIKLSLGNCAGYL